MWMSVWLPDMEWSIVHSFIAATQCSRVVHLLLLHKPLPHLLKIVRSTRKSSQHTCVNYRHRREVLVLVKVKLSIYYY